VSFRRCFNFRSRIFNRECSPLSRPSTIILLSTVACISLAACANVEYPSDSASPPIYHQDDSVTVPDELRKSALQGNADAQNKLGLHYNEGLGVPQNYGEAKQWFEKSAKQGHSGAQVNLGTLYLLEHGVPQSDQMALFWFRQAAEQEDVLAFAKLGFMYTNGRGVLQDFIQAHMWYNLSAAHGEARAIEARDALAKQMTPAQVAEAQKLAREWKSKAK